MNVFMFYLVIISDATNDFLPGDNNKDLLKASAENMIWKKNNDNDFNAVYRRRRRHHHHTIQTLYLDFTFNPSFASWLQHPLAR